MGAEAVGRRFLVERCIVAVLRVARILLRRPELANPIIQSLNNLLLLRTNVRSDFAQQIVCGIHEVSGLAQRLATYWGRVLFGTHRIPFSGV